MQYEDIYNANSLYTAFKKARRGSAWKESVQRYECNLLLNIYDTREALAKRTYQQKPFVEFDLCERGKQRHIKSMHVSDRVVQRSACDNVFTPALRRYLTYDNGASLEGKGVDFARRRLETHLHKFYRKHGNHGYILLLDCSKFFDNLLHEILQEQVHGKIPDDCEDFFAYLVSTFKIDVTSFSEQEIAQMKTGVFNSLEYHKRPKTNGHDRVWLEKSVGIGSQISQDCGVFLPTRADNYAKIVKGVKYYGRYMDDSYAISESKEFLHQLKLEMIEQYRAIGLTINEKKTQICRIDKGFTWLQTKYHVTDTGKVVKRLPHDAVVRMRRKLKKLRLKLDTGEMSYPDIEQMYKSWRGNAEKYDSYHTLQNIDKLFNELYGGYQNERARTETAGNYEPCQPSFVQCI